MTNNSTHREQPWLDAWYGQRRWTLLLLPVMWLFILLAAVRRYWVVRYLQKSFVTPVIVVGNISVGGTGKTPLLISLVTYLQQQGFAPGVISRGYGGTAPHYPYLLDATSTAAQTGDEPLAIFQRTQCKVCVGADRIASARLLEDEGCDILLSDDGLQHYRLGRALEIAVVDGQRGLGNGFRLPVGPLRESVARLKTVDWVVVNSPPDDFQLPQLPELFYIPMQIKPIQLINLQSGESIALETLAFEALAQESVHAVAGIGNPERFYKTLNACSLKSIPHSFPDHHAYTEADFNFGDSLMVVMTEKDAVKCRAFAKTNWYYLPIVAELPDSFWQAFSAKLEKICERPANFYIARKK